MEPGVLGTVAVKLVTEVVEMTGEIVAADQKILSLGSFGKFNG